MLTSHRRILPKESGGGTKSTPPPSSSANAVQVHMMLYYMHCKRSVLSFAEHGLGYDLRIELFPDWQLLCIWLVLSLINADLMTSFITAVSETILAFWRDNQYGIYKGKHQPNAKRLSVREKLNSQIVTQAINSHSKASPITIGMAKSGYYTQTIAS